MKYFIYLLFPTFLFAQEDVQLVNLKNKLSINFGQKSGYFDSKYLQDLSLEKNNELLQNYVKNYVNQPISIYPLNPIEEKITYRYDDTMTNRENFIRSVVHELFLSKPLKLGK